MLLNLIIYLLCASVAVPCGALLLYAAGRVITLGVLNSLAQRRKQEEREEQDEESKHAR